MPKYLVRVEGHGCRIRIRSADGSIATTSGFLTTRFVEAPGPQEAQQRAFALIQMDLATLDADGSLDTCRLSADEIREDPRAFDVYAPGAGFTWY